MARKRPKNDIVSNGVRNDGYYDAVCRSGTEQYIKNNTYYETKIDDNTCTLLYRNALVRKIISCVIDDCVKNWMTVDGDEENKVVQFLEEIDAESAFVEAGYWDRLYGRSCIFMVVDDGGDVTDPINFKKINKLVSLEVFDKRNIWQDTTSALVNDDPNDMNFGKPEYYQITPPNCSPFWVHHSRVLMFNGDILPRAERIANNGAGLSCLDGLVGAIRRNDTVQARAYDIVERLSTCVLKLEGLSQVLQTEEGTKIVQDRLNLIDLARNLLNTVAIDKEDEFQIHNMMIGGISTIIQEFEQYVSGLTGIPMTILFGRSPGGMNSTGTADFENYYNLVRRYQKTRMKPNLEKLIKIVMCSKEGPFKGQELESWEIKFNELHTPTETEEASLKGQQQKNKTDEVNMFKLFIDMGVTDADKARKELLKLGYSVSKSKVEQPQQEGGNPLEAMMGGGATPTGKENTQPTTTPKAPKEKDTKDVPEKQQEVPTNNAEQASVDDKTEGKE